MATQYGTFQDWQAEQEHIHRTCRYIPERGVMFCEGCLRVWKHGEFNVEDPKGLLKKEEKHGERKEAG